MYKIIHTTPNAIGFAHAGAKQETHCHSHGEMVEELQHVVKLLVGKNKGFVYCAELKGGSQARIQLDNGEVYHVEHTT